MVASVASCAARLSLRADNLGKLARMGPHQHVAGPINQTTNSAGYSGHKHIEVMSGDADVIRSSYDQRRRADLVQPRAAVERDEPSGRTAHGRGIIGGHEGLRPFGLLLCKSDCASGL